LISNKGKDFCKIIPVVKSNNCSDEITSPRDEKVEAQTLMWKTGSYLQISTKPWVNCKQPTTCNWEINLKYKKKKLARQNQDESNGELIELFCIARLSRIEEEERRRRAWTEMKANGNFQLKKNLEKKFIKKRPKLMNRTAFKEVKNIFTVVKAEKSKRIFRFIQNLE
jgi:hypothetical protein